MYLLLAYLLLVVGVSIYGYYDLRKKPKPVTNFLWSFEMKNAKVTLGWKKSVSSDVVNQHVLVNVNGVESLSVDLPVDVESLEVGTFAEHTVLTATHTVADGSGKTASVDAPSFTVPDLEVPMAATDFGWTYEVVEDVVPV